MNTARRAGVFYSMAAVLLAALLFAGGTSARAQGGIKLDAQAGLDGVCKLGSWMPVRVRAENSGADAEVRLQVSYQNDQGGRSVFAVNRLSLPSASRKEFFFYIPVSFSIGKVSAQVLDGENELAQKELRVSCGPEDDLYFGVLSETPTAFDLRADLRSWNGGRARVALLTLSDFPDQPQGLSALDALVISNADTGGLSAEQKQSLHLWMANGGVLFVTGGINWQATTAGLGELLPMKISSTSNAADLSALSSYLREDSAPQGGVALASGTVSEGAHILIAQDGVPLLVETRIGFGRAYYFAADPTLRPLSQWDGMKALYRELLTFNPGKPAWADSEWNSYETGAALAALPELNLPTFLYICCWLGAYIVVVGPLNYLVLRRLKRMELAWATIPILVVIFSCAAYAFGFIYRGSDPILHRLALAQSWDGVSYAHSNDLIGIYSPSRATYNVQAREGFMFRQQRGMDSNLQGSGDWIQLENEQGVALPDLRVDIGGMATFGAEGYIPALDIRHDLTLTLTKKTPALAGTITNAGKHTLRDAALITPDGWQVLGDLAPNQSQKISLSISSLTGRMNVPGFLNDLGLPYYSPASKDIDAERRAAFLRASLSNGGSEAVFAGGIYLMGWVDDLPAPVDLQDRKSRTVDGMLYFRKIEPDIVADPQAFTLNAGMYEWESSAGSLATQIPSGGYEVRLRPIVPVEFDRVNSLKINIFSRGGASGFIDGYLWNFESRTWDEIPNLSHDFMPNPSQYVGASGELRFLFDVSVNDFGEINAVNFELQASQ